MKFIWMVFYCGVLWAAKDESVIVAVHASQSLKVPGLFRALTANSKIAKVRALPPASIVITGMKMGETTVRAWGRKDGREVEHVFQVQVVAGEIKRALQSDSRVGVIRVALEFLETSFSFGENFGIHWPESLNFTGSGSVGNMSGLNISGTFSSAQGWIDHMIKEGFAKMIANPELYVRLGEEASFHSGGELPVTSAAESYGRFFRKVEWKPYGLSVKVRPQSIDEVHVSSDVFLEISEVNPGLSSEGVPSLNKRRLETKINSLDGQTVILSGLTRKSDREDESRVPILGAIPLIGALFTDSRSSSDGTDILMAVTFSMTSRAREEHVREKFMRKFEKRGPHAD